jgi:hypothetical protein
MADTVEQLEARTTGLRVSGAQWLRDLAIDLHRRRVYRAVVTYVVVAWIVLQIADVTFPLFGFSGTSLKIIACVTALGLPATVVVAWIYQLTPNGLVVDQGVDLLSRGARQDFAIVILTIGIAAALLAALLYAGQPAGSRSVAIAATEISEPGVPGSALAARLEAALERQLHADDLEPVSTFSGDEPVAFVLWIHLTSSLERVHVRLILLETDRGGSAPFVDSFDEPRVAAHELERRVAERITQAIRPRLADDRDVHRLGSLVW